MRGDILIGVDGVHSIIRKGLKDNRTPRYAGYTCWRGLTTMDHESVIRNDIYDLPPIKNWGKGRCTLLGDAAHASTPNLAQGGGMALEDAIELAYSLLKYSDVQQALRVFERQRYSRTSAIVRDSRLFGKMSQWRHPLLVKIRNSSVAFWFSKRGMKKYAGYRVPSLN